MIKIYSFGSNGSGQLAIGSTDDVAFPTEALFLDKVPHEPIRQLRAGGNHTLLLIGDTLFYSGNFYNHTLSFSGSNDKFQQVRLPSDFNIYNCSVVCCAASWEATILAVRDETGHSNKIYTFGNGHYGELGQGEIVLKLGEAQQIREFPPPGLEINDLSASVSHVVTVLSNGDVYGWGNGRKGQLGQPKQIVYHPRKVTGLDFKVRRAVCGREFTCFFGEPDSGRFIVMGSDKWNIITSAPSDTFGWKDVGAGWGSIHVLKHNGKLNSWGRNDHGQLAPPSLPQLSKMAVGSEHVLGLTNEGDFLAWGWGEHGNCGPLTSDGVVKSKWNTINMHKYLPSSEKLSGIGAGCATSWVYTECTKK